MSNLETNQSRLLVVDDSKISRLMLADFLKRLGYQVEQAESGEQALARLQAEHFDLLLLDVQMPGMSGHQVLEKLRETPLFHQLPVIVVSASTGLDIVVSCIQAGAEDFITKPFERTLLRTRVEALLEKKRLRDLDKSRRLELEALKLQLEEKNRALEDSNRILERMAFTDALTDLPNRRFSLDAINRLFELYRRNARLFSIVLMDIDHFKSVNDTYGHEGGDHVLKVAGQIGRAACRESDMFCRFGGEEFVVICPESNAEGAVAVAERIRQRLEQRVMDFDGKQFKITGSFGVACIHEHITRPQLLIALADEALYQSKKDGRNRITVATSSSSPPS